MSESLEDRVGKLLRVKADEALAKAPDRARAVTALLSDIDNQLIQVKTELVVAVAGRHKFDDSAAKIEAEIPEWIAQASAAAAANRDDEARAAAERAVDLRRRAAQAKARAKESHERSEHLRVLYLDLQAHRREIERLRANASGSLDGSGGATPESEVDLLLKQLRATAPKS